MARKGRPYRLGVIGFAHMHVNELVARFVAHDGVDLVACADTVPRVPSITEVEGSRKANLKRALAASDGVKAFADYREMLDSEELDIVIFCPEIARHAEIAEALADRRIHMLTEKPMAASLSDALRMARAARQADVVLMVDWPITWRPWVLVVKGPHRCRQDRRRLGVQVAKRSVSRTTGRRQPAPGRYGGLRCPDR